MTPAEEYAAMDCVPKRDQSGALIQPTATHDKVYSDFLQFINPPRRFWICRKCGTQGTDFERCANVTEYDQLVAKFGGGRVIGISYGV